MKATGIVRKVDPLGRVVIPMELRRTMKIEEDTPIEIFVHDESIVLRKYQPRNGAVDKVQQLLTIHSEEEILNALLILEKG